VSAVTFAELSAEPHTTNDAAELPLYTCNPDDFQGLSHLVEVVHTNPSLS
jgi:hypothetical protein